MLFRNVRELPNGMIADRQKQNFPTPFLALLVLFATVPCATAEIKALGKVPAQPIPVSVRVERGKSVDIPLRVYGATHEDVEYRVRTAPEHGTLIDSRMLDANKGIVTYQHSGEFGHDSDLFRFAAKSANGVSAPIVAKIEIFDQPADLVAPKSAEFGEVLIGTGATVRVTIANEGGGIDRGDVSATSPWKVAGEPTYELGAGERATFTVVCAPESEGEVFGTLRYSSSPASSTMLHATGTPPFRIDPQELQLAFDPESGVRAGTVLVENLAQLDQVLEIEGGSAFGLPATVTLPAGTPVELPVKVPPEHLAAIDGTVVFTGTGHEEKLHVTAPIVPAILETDLSRMVFRKVVMGEPAVAEFEISNRGGDRIFVYLSVESPFTIAKDAREFTLESGEKRKIAVEITPNTSGIIERTLSIRAFENDREIEIVAMVPKVERAPEEVRLDSRPRATREDSKPEDVRIPRLPKVRLRAVTTTTATLAWPATSDATGKFRLEARILRFAKDAGKVEARWIPFSEVTVEKDGDEMLATAENLTPGGAYTVRVASVDAAGSVVGASEPVSVIPTARNRWKITPLKVLLVAFVAVVGLIARQRKLAMGNVGKS